MRSPRRLAAMAVIAILPRTISASAARTSTRGARRSALELPYDVPDVSHQGREGPGFAEQAVSILQRALPAGRSRPLARRGIPDPRASHGGGWRGRAGISGYQRRVAASAGACGGRDAMAGGRPTSLERTWGDRDEVEPRLDGARSSATMTGDGDDRTPCCDPPRARGERLRRG